MRALIEGNAKQRPPGAPSGRGRRFAGGGKAWYHRAIGGIGGIGGVESSCVARKQRGKGSKQAPLGEDTYHLRRRRNCMRGILPAEEGEGEGEGEHMRAWCCLPVT